ncbi:unnamed protein product, partial [Iphiclides podalirius]
MAGDQNYTLWRTLPSLNTSKKRAGNWIAPGPLISGLHFNEPALGARSKREKMIILTIIAYRARRLQFRKIRALIRSAPDLNTGADIGSSYADQRAERDAGSSYLKRAAAISRRSQ